TNNFSKFFEVHAQTSHIGRVGVPSLHLICCGNRLFAKFPGLRGILCTPILVDATQRATQVAALTGPSGLWGGRYRCGESRTSV
ncbi:MAG: hypothetical protein NWE87_07325, partial [Candidatus Bathyarchaeota archaeon]|nr:hypothetical protein [Candidatus Bathyarchaeota archaeon]